MASSSSLAKLQARLAAIPKAARDAVAAADLKSADDLAKAIRREAPKDSGGLSDSIVVTPAGQSTPAYSTGGAHTVPEGAVAVTAGDSAVRYASHVEFGTIKMGAEPFFWPTVRTFRERIRRRRRKAFKAALETDK